LKKITYDNVETLRKALTERLGKAPRGTLYYIRSGSRQFWFTWFFKSHRLAVSVTRLKTRRFSVPRDLVAEALVARLREESWTCPRCGKSFRRIGRKKFCSTTCGTAWRVARLRYSRKMALLRAKRAAAEDAELARPETQAEMRRVDTDRRRDDLRRKAIVLSRT